MHKSTSTAFWVWGAILTVIGAGMLYGGMGSFAVVLLVIGISLIAGGIARAIYVDKYNKELDAREGDSLSGECHVCNHIFTVPRRMFRPHRNFPEGYTICPSCKKPISIRKFTPVK